MLFTGATLHVKVRVFQRRANYLMGVGSTSQKVLILNFSRLSAFAVYGTKVAILCVKV
jgi:hypothetical protein